MKKLICPYCKKPIYNSQDQIKLSYKTKEVTLHSKCFDKHVEKVGKRPDPDTKEDYLLKMDREAREEKRKRLGEFADKPRIQVGQLVRWGRKLQVIRNIDETGGLCLNNYGNWIYPNDKNLEIVTHAEIMEFAKKAPK